MGWDQSMNAIGTRADLLALSDTARSIVEQMTSKRVCGRIEGPLEGPDTTDRMPARRPKAPGWGFSFGRS